MEQTVVRVEGVPVAFDMEVLARKLRIRPGQTAALNKLGKLAEEARRLAKPQAAAVLCGVRVLSDAELEVGGVTLASPLLRKNMGELGRVFPFLATEGRELAEWSASLDSALDQVFSCELREAAVKQYERLLEHKLLEVYGIKQLSAMNPGSLDVWPVTQQEQLFRILNPIPEQFGVELLPSFMMKPEYSLSGIFFQTDTKYYNCRLCPRLDCPNRKAAYKPE